MVQNLPGKTGACFMAKLIRYPWLKWTLSMKKPVESWLLGNLIFQVTPSPARPKVRVTRPTLGKPGSVLFLQSEGLPSYQQNWLMRCAFDEEHTWQPHRRKWQYQLMDQHVQHVGRRQWTALSCLQTCQTRGATQYKKAANQLRVYYRCPLWNQLLN